MARLDGSGPGDAPGPSLKVARLQRILSALEAASTAVTSLSLFVVMVVVVTDVVWRYLFNTALSWPYDLISMYLMAAIFLLALSSTLGDHHHIRVDLLFRRAPPHARHVMELIGYILIAIVMAGILYTGSTRFWTSFRAGDVVMTSVAWPAWLSALLVPLGVGLLLLRLVFGMCSLVIALATGAKVASGVDEVPGTSDG